MKRQFGRTLTLQDVVRAVSQFARNDHETALVVADLLNRGLVRARVNVLPRRRPAR